MKSIWNLGVSKFPNCLVDLWHIFRYLQENIDLTGKLPASVLGDMWGRFWNNIYKYMIPYPEKPNIDPTEEMIAQNYTVEKMFQVSNLFERPAPPFIIHICVKS